MTEAHPCLVEAQALIDSHRYTDAVGLLQRHLKGNPHDSDADYLLGVAAYGSKDDDLAVTSLQRFRRADPENELAEFGLDMALRQQRRPEPPVPPAPGPAPDNRARLLALTVGLGLALTVAIVVLFLLPGQKRFEPIQVGDRPEGVAVAKGVVWVASRDGAVTRVEPDDPSTRRIGLGIGKNLDSVVISDGSVWVSDEDQGKVARLDESSRKHRGSDHRRRAAKGAGRRRRLARGSRTVAAPSFAFLSSPARVRARSQCRGIPVASRTRADACTSRCAPPTTAVGARPAPPARSRPWTSAGTRSRPGPFDGSATRPTLPSRSTGSGSRTRLVTGCCASIPTRERSKASRFGSDRSLTAVAADEDGVWALSRKPPNRKADEGTVTRIDPATGKRVGNPITIGGDPYEIAIEKGRVWVTQAGKDKVTPIKP